MTDVDEQPDRNYSADLDRALLSQYADAEVVTAVVLVKESLTEDGVLKLTWENSDRMTPWHAAGMLRRALNYYESLGE